MVCDRGCVDGGSLEVQLCGSARMLRDGMKGYFDKLIRHSEKKKKKKNDL